MNKTPNQLYQNDLGKQEAKELALASLPIENINDLLKILNVYENAIYRDSLILIEQLG